MSIVGLFVVVVAAARAAEDAGAGLAVGGFVEAYGAWNTNRPDNGVTALRGFDGRHGTFALSLASVHAGVDHGALRGRVALQAGPTALSYFAAEPATAAGPGVAPTGASALHVVREAWAGTAVETGPGRLELDGGVFLSPVGYDAIAVKDNRFWSLSHLGVGLPFYFTGLRATQRFSGAGGALTVGLFNGWNSIVDNNTGKTAMLSYGQVADSGAEFQVLTMGGVEQATGSDWRQLLDVWADVPVGPVGVLVGLDGGLEARAGGLHHWQAGQVGAEWSGEGGLRAGARADVFREDGPSGLAGNIFWPTRMIGSGTAAMGWTPGPGFLVRVEARHDRAADPVFFAAGSLRPTASAQTTVTLGVTGWFNGEARLLQP